MSARPHTPPTPPTPRFIKQTQLAAALSISPETLRGWVKRGAIPAPTRINGRNYYPVSILDRFAGPGGGAQAASEVTSDAMHLAGNAAASEDERSSAGARRRPPGVVTSWGP